MFKRKRMEYCYHSPSRPTDRLQHRYTDKEMHIKTNRTDERCLDLTEFIPATWTDERQGRHAMLPHTFTYICMIINTSVILKLPLVLCLPVF